MKTLNMRYLYAVRAIPSREHRIIFWSSLRHTYCGLTYCGTEHGWVAGVAGFVLFRPFG